MPRRPDGATSSTILSEFDLDAALKRRPGLILVDELAHTNFRAAAIPSATRTSRSCWMPGIDVYTTVNIQHIESLNDVVAQITRVRVREIVPDAILDRADAIELVDLTPDDLIQRLKEGKVYVPKQAERALKNYFSPANLTALRELALRRTAERVDEQLLEQMQARAISRSVGGGRAHSRVRQRGSALGRPCALRQAPGGSAARHPGRRCYVETARSLQFSEEAADRVAATMRLAERLDGEAITIPATARRIADDVLSFARKSNVTHIIIGKSTRSRWFEILHGSVVHDLVRRAGNISVHVIAGEEVAEQPPASRRGRRRMVAGNSMPLPYLVALHGRGWRLGRRPPRSAPASASRMSISIFLTAIVGIAVRYGLWPSLLASVAASLAYNFFFLPPIYTFTITDPTNIAAFVLFTVAEHRRIQPRRARPHARRSPPTNACALIESLYAFSRKLAGAGTLDDVLWATAYQIALMLKVRVVLLLPENGSIALKAGYPPEDTLDEADLAAAKWAWEKNRPAGRELGRAARGQVAVLAHAHRPGPNRHRWYLSR